MRNLILALVAILIMALSCPFPALAGNPCRKSVIIYLDVSGSMYEKQNYITYGTDTTPISLIEAMTRVIKDAFLDATSGAVSKGDRFSLKGFYSDTRDIIASIESYDPVVHRDMIVAEMDRQLLKRDSSSQISLKANPNTHFHAQTGNRTVTDFSRLLNDLAKQEAGTVFDTATGGFRQAVIVILTDGGHDIKTKEAFEDALKNAKATWEKHHERKEASIFLFTLNRNSLPKDEYDVCPKLKADLNALSTSLTVNQTISPNTVSAKISDDLNGSVSIDHMAISPDPFNPENSAELVKTRQLNATLRMFNSYCHPISIDSIKWTLSRIGKRKNPHEETIVGEGIVRPGQTLVSSCLNENKTTDIPLQLSLKSPLEADNYKLVVTPTIHGKTVQFKSEEFTIKTPPRNPWIAFGVISFFVIAITAYFMIFRRK